MTGGALASWSLFSQTAGWALIHSLWQAAALALALGAVLALLPQRLPALRYWTACLALLAMVVMPVATAMLLHAPASSAPAGEALPLSQASAVTTSAAPLAAPGGRQEATPPMAVHALLPWLVCCWLLGVAVATAYHTGGWIAARRLVRLETTPVAASLRRRLRELAQRLGIRRPLEVLCSRRLQVPAVVGVLRPVILVPAAVLSGLSPAQLEAILIHELAHIRRHDMLTNLIQVALESLLFYHPAAWWVSRTIRAERESCCDQVAAGVAGSPVEYARALAELEGLRGAVPSLAMAAAGGKLLTRLRRLLGVQPQRSVLPRAGVAAILAVVLGTFGAAAAVSNMDETGAPAGLPVVVATALAPAPPAGSDDADAAGRWSAEWGDETVWLELRYHNRSRTSFSLPADDLVEQAGGASYLLQRDAGTFTFRVSSGSRAQGEASGRYDFHANPSYQSALEQRGMSNASDRQLFSAALFDVSLAFIDELAQLGYDNESLKQLIEFRIHGVSPGFVREMAAAGYEDLSSRTLVEFRIHGVSPDFVAAVAAAGFEDLPSRKLIEFRIHGVSAQFVQEMAAAGYADLSARDLIEFRIHGVSPGFVREMAAAGFDDLTARTLIEFRIHGVSPELVREMATYGLTGLSARQAIEFRIHGVTPEYIKEMEAAGLDSLGARSLVELRIHGATPEYVREIADAGYPDLEAREVVEFRIHGVSAAFIAEVRAEGFTDLTPSELVKARIRGMDWLKRRR